MRLLLPFSLLLFYSGLFAQVVSENYTFNKAKIINVSNQRIDFFPSLMLVESPYPDGKTEYDILQNLKQKISSSPSIYYKNEASAFQPKEVEHWMQIFWK